MNTTPVLSLYSSNTAGADPVADFISALIGTETYDPRAYKVSDSMINHHRKVHEFCVEYQQVTGNSPSPELLLSKFPNFPFDPDVEISWAVHQLHQDNKSRSLRGVVAKAARSLVDEDPDQCMQSMLAGLRSIPGNRRAPASAYDVELANTALKPGVPVADPTLQRLTGGIRPGELWYLGARAGRGKSWALARHAVKAASAGFDVTLFTLEMSAGIVAKRMQHLMVPGIADHPVCEQERLIREWSADKGQISIITQGIGNPCTTVSVAAEASSTSLTMIDHIGLMRTNEGNRASADHHFASQISNELREISLAYDAPIMAAVQLNRDGEDSAVPSLSELSGTDDHSRDPNVVYYLRSKLGSRVQMNYLLKNREGVCGVSWYVDFRPDLGTFTEIHPEHAKALAAEERLQAMRAGL